MNRTIEQISAKEMISAHWMKRYSDTFPKVPTSIITALKDCDIRDVLPDMVDAIKIAHKPILDAGEVVGVWINEGHVARPVIELFAEQWNEETKCFDMWVYYEMERKEI